MPIIPVIPHELCRAKHFAGLSSAAVAVLAAAVLILPPLAGARLRGGDGARYLEFPPRTVYAVPAAFSWPAFAIVAAGALAIAVPVAVHLARAARRRPRGAPAARFPAWGWGGLALMLCGWALAWTRLPALAGVQRFMFTPPWLGYILLMQALTQRRRGACRMSERPRAFALLFPLSAAFWWYFEYLNRFAQNWHYEGLGEMSASGYALMASLAFSTVLPAVLGTYDWLTAELRAPTAAARPAEPYPRPSAVGRRAAAGGGLLAAAAALLLCLPLARNLCFPALWLAPAAALAGARMLAGRAPLAAEPGEALGPRIARLAVAALLCGFFWELWNYGSLARWVYAVPYVGRFHLFEMPALGYAGYLPFGVECGLVADLLLRRRPEPDRSRA